MLQLILPFLLWPYALFLFFCAYVTIMHAKEGDRLKDVNWLFRLACWITVISGVIIDVGFNIIFGSFIFLEFPKEWTFTVRCSRWMKLENGGWRTKLARSTCTNLGIFDEGHCGVTKEGN